MGERHSSRLRAQHAAGSGVSLSGGRYRAAGGKCSLLRGPSPPSASLVPSIHSLVPKALAQGMAPPPALPAPPSMLLTPGCLATCAFRLSWRAEAAFLFIVFSIRVYHRILKNILFIYLFIYFWLFWVLVATHGIFIAARGIFR